MSNDIPYPFRQNSNFYYLSGFDEPSSILALEKRADGKEQTYLFCQPNDPNKEKWDGPRTGPARATEAFSVDDAFVMTELDHFLERKLHEIDNVFVSKVQGNSPYEDIINAKNIQSVDITKTIEQIRLIKTEAEINVMKKAGEISGLAFQEVMKKTYPGMTQIEIEGILEFECKKKGCKRLAYPPVVASGISNNTLHYVFNDSIINDGDLVLVDAGGEYFNYASDITRTFPASGKFTPAQKDIYNAVLTAQKKCIEFCRTSVFVNNNNIRMSLYNLHVFSVMFLEEELESLGLIFGKNDIHQFYPHMIGHYLGIDTHDTSSVSVTESLMPGMVVTVEPGIYIPDDPSIPEKYRGIGIRIEDDVLITEDGPTILTSLAPKEIDHIESIMAKV